jgi:N-formylglutamate amidohydrolase
VNNILPPSTIIHLPHASRAIPADVREAVCLSDSELEAQLDRLTDHYTDELFSAKHPDVIPLVYPVSRFVVDPERFSEDVLEPMAMRGQGAVYTKTVDGLPFRNQLSLDDRNSLMDRFYWPHHNQLDHLAGTALAAHGRALIVDAHSFPSSPLPVDLDQSADRPDICIGSDEFHTPVELVDVIKVMFKDAGFSVGVNNPYCGTLVPNQFYGKDNRVKSVMIEINRRLYLQDEPKDIRKREPEFSQLRTLLSEVILRLVRSG